MSLSPFHKNQIAITEKMQCQTECARLHLKGNIFLFLNICPKWVAVAQLGRNNIAPESHEFLFYSSRDNTKLEKYLKIFYVYLQLCTFPGHREATEEPIPAILCDWLQHTERLLLSFPSEFTYSVLVPAQSFYLYLQPCPLLCFPTLFLLFSHKMSSVQFSLKKRRKTHWPLPASPLPDKWKKKSR